MPEVLATFAALVVSHARGFRAARPTTCCSIVHVCLKPRANAIDFFGGEIEVTFSSPCGMQIRAIRTRASHEERGHASEQSITPLEAFKRPNYPVSSPPPSGAAAASGSTAAGSAASPAGFAGECTPISAPECAAMLP